MSSSNGPVGSEPMLRAGPVRATGETIDASRRGALRQLAAAGAVIGLAQLTGCGFRLRGDVKYTFATAMIKSPTAPQFGLELQRMLATGSETKITDNPAEATVIIDITSVNDDKGVLSLSSGGRAREYVLTKRVAFNVHDAAGNDWLPPSEITVRRTYTFNESEVLAREAQEQRLFKEMQTDAVQQVMRRLQSAKKSE